MQAGKYHHRAKQAGIIGALFLAILLFTGVGITSGRAQTETLNCNTTASSVGLDLILPIEPGGHEFKTGAWVYHTPGSDHDVPKDYCALDFLEVEGKQVVAVAKGNVVAAKWDSDITNPGVKYGYYVVVEHSGVSHEEGGKKYQYYSLYAHLKDPQSANLPAACKVFVGKPVKAGDCLGISGDTGKGGAHLHFSMYSGTAAFANVSPLAPETSRGIKRYGTLNSKQDVQSMATAATDDTNVPALSLNTGETKNQTFTFTNTSKIEWGGTNRFELVRISGSSEGTPERVPLPENVKPGEQAMFVIPVRGTSPNVYASEWQLYHNDVAFGPVVKLRYQVGVDTNQDVGSFLWPILKPIITDLLRDLLERLLQNLWNELVRRLSSICGLVPLGALGLLFAVVQSGARREQRSPWKPYWRGRGSWLAVIFSAVRVALIFLFAFLLLAAARELLWWSGPIKNIGLVVLFLGLLALTWGLIRGGQWLRILGVARTLILLVLIILPLTYFHGQKYRSDEPALPRYVSSMGDLALLSGYHVREYWGTVTEFTMEVVDALRESQGNRTP